MSDRIQCSIKDRMIARCKETRRRGIECDMKLGKSRKQAELQAGLWAVSMRVDHMEELLALVKELESSHAAARDEWQVKLLQAETQARKLAKALEVCLNALEDVEYQCSSTDRRSCPWCQSDDWVWSQRLGRNALRHEDGCQRQEAIATAARALLGLAEVSDARALARKALEE